MIIPSSFSYLLSQILAFLIFANIISLKTMFILV